MDVLHLRFVLTIKSQVSPILSHHVDIWEGLFKEIDARVDAHR
jgi:hypothetical protein